MGEVMTQNVRTAGAPPARVIARVVVVALLAALLVPLAQFEVWATPVTLSETVHGFERAPAEAQRGIRVASLAAAKVRSVATEAPIAFSAIGMSVPAGVDDVYFRTSEDGETWTVWDPIEFLDAQDGPDAGVGEPVLERDVRHSEPLWVGEAAHIQLEVEGGDPEDVEVTFIDSMRLNGGPVERHVEPAGGAQAAAAEDDTSYLETLGEQETDQVYTAAANIELDIVSRARWGADESLGSDTHVADDVSMGVVHHTAHASGDKANNYTREEAPGIMRAMYQYHTKTLGWADIGYNVVIDRFGTVYEGRKGGFENGVIGAHARGFNTGSFGVSVMGNFYEEQASPEAIRSLTDVIALKSAIHGIDPGATTTRMGDGTRRPTIVGHRDVGQTACPGLIYELLPQIREEARQKAVRFPDVPADSPHRTSVVELAMAGVTKGCRLNEYCPTDGLSRAQASSFVVQALELDPIPGSHFPDVGTDGVHSSAINALAERGWLIGYPDGTFRPWQKLTRGQLATLLAKSMGQPLIVPPWDPYPDVPRDSTHAPGITALSEMGIRGDCGGGNFCPNDMVLRDSTATFVNEIRKLRP